MKGTASRWMGTVVVAALGGCLAAPDTGAPAPARDADFAAKPAVSSQLGPAGGGASGGVAIEQEVGVLVDGRTPPEPSPARGPERVRAWFPDTLLWRPAVVTSDDGRASVALDAPDTVTTWRLLALAHDRDGAQAGTVHEVAASLPVVAEVVAPQQLVVGDRVDAWARVDAVDRAYEGAVEVRGVGSVAGVARATVRVERGSSQLVPVTLRASAAGEGAVEVALDDALGAAVVTRQPLRVLPAGRPHVVARSGLLAGRVELPLPAAASGPQRVVVQVLGGAVSVLLSELERAERAPGSPHSFAVIEALEALATAGRVQVDPARLRALRLRALQGLLRQVDGPVEPVAAARLLVGLPPTADDPLLVSVRERLVAAVRDGQRGDGTWSSQPSSTPQRVLVETALCASVLPPDAVQARDRAAGALERLGPRVDDPYTAAWALTTGLIPAASQPSLVARVRDGVDADPAGRRVVPLSPEVLGPGGAPPSAAEALAVAWLALQGPSSPPWRDELVTSLLLGIRPDAGLGAGWADPVALRVVRDALPPLDLPTRVRLSRGDVELGVAAIDPTAPRAPALLDTDVAGELALEAEPAVPGLLWVAQHTTWTPFRGDEGVAGIDVEASLPPLRRGQPGTLRLTLRAPAGEVVELEQPLPGGVHASLTDAAAERLDAVRVVGDHVWLRSRPFGVGEALVVEVDVIPAFAGQLWTRPLELRVAGDRVLLEPVRWDVR